MNGLKTIQLLKLLSPKDLRMLTSVLKKHKRSSLFRLFNLSNKLIKQKKNYSVKEFFELFYAKKYSRSQDNVFRNELRLLTGEIEKLLAEKQQKKEWKKNEYLHKKYFLQELFHLGAYELLGKGLKKVFKQIEQNEDYVFFYDFFLLWTRLKSKNIKVASSFLSEAQEQFDKLFFMWQKEAGIKTKKIEVFKSYIERINLMVNREFRFSEELNTIDFEKAKTDSAYYNFLSNKSKALKSSGEDKITVLLEMKAQLTALKNKDIDIKKEQFTTLQYLGVEYMIRSDYKMAAHYFEESFSIGYKLDNETFSKAIFNYVSTLIKLKRYQKAIELYDGHYNKIKESNVLDLFHCIIAMCYVFTSQLNKAEQVNSIIDSGKSVDNYLYSRCNLAIIYFLNDEKELALNELVNIKQSIQYHKNQDKVYQDFTSKFSAFIQCTFSKLLIKENQSKLISFKQSLLNIKNKASLSYGGDSLHIEWLLEKVKAVILS